MENFSYKILPLEIYLSFQEITPSLDIHFSILKGLQISLQWMYFYKTFHQEIYYWKLLKKLKNIKYNFIKYIKS